VIPTSCCYALAIVWVVLRQGVSFVHEIVFQNLYSMRTTCSIKCLNEVLHLFFNSPLEMLPLCCVYALGFVYGVCTHVCSLASFDCSHASYSYPPCV
jgi:hypothetical protein